MIRTVSPDFAGDAYFSYFPLSDRTDLKAGISLISAGDMKFPDADRSEQRNRLFSRLGVGEDRVVSLRQIHSRTVFPVTDRNEVNGYEGDGLVTERSDLVLGVTVADCLPVFLYSRDGSCFGVVHSGWKGTGIAVEAVKLMMKQYGVAPRSVGALLGPCIASCCYNVPLDRADVFRTAFGNDAVREDGGKYFLDLRQANILLLEKLGVGEISVVDACTSCTDSLGSFRRQGAGNFTRMFACIGRW